MTAGAGTGGHPTTTDADVAVVGAGPVGLTLAVLLAQLGRSVVVLERFPEPYRLPRAVHFDDEVGRIFQSCGIGDEVRAVSEPAEVYEWRNGSGTTLLRFGRIGAGPSGWPFSSMSASRSSRRRSRPGRSSSGESGSAGACRWTGSSRTQQG